MSTRVANVKVSTLIAKLTAKRAAIESEASAELARIDAALATVNADGWAESQRADFVSRLNAGLLSGDYRVTRYNEIVRADAATGPDLGRCPEPNVDEARERLNSDRQTVQRSLDAALSALDDQIDVLSMTVEAESGEGTVEVELGFNPIAEFARLKISKAEYVSRYETPSKSKNK